MRSGTLRSIAVRLAVVAVLCPCGPALAADDSATLVIYRPKRFSGGAAFSSYRVDGQSLGKFKHGVFEIEIDPGLHEVRNFYPASREEKYDKLNGAMKYGSFVIEVNAAPGATVHVHQQSSGQLEVAARSKLDDEFDRTPRRTPLVARVEGTFVTPSETTAWEHCSAGAVRDCRDYLQRFPYGAFVGEANAALVAATPKPEVVTIPARTRQLPVGIQRDKYMISLTSALKEERYADAIVYFGELEQLEVELSPSFWFYYGEALYETGEYDAAIDKLYAYIAEAGSGGEHYHRALELSTEAEEH